MISVITINYNNKEGLEKTIRSVITQRDASFEYIVVDGNSTDGSKRVLEKYCDQISTAISEPDTGIYNAMNKGIKATKGDYLLFLNSGDLLCHKDILNEAESQLTGNQDIVYGNLKYNLDGKEHIATFPKVLSFEYFYKESLPHPASFIKRSLFDRVFLYNEGYKIVSDWEFFMCAICKFKASYLHIDMVVSNFEVGGISWDPKNKEVLNQERRLSLEKYFPDLTRDMIQKEEKSKQRQKTLVGRIFSKLFKK